MKKSLLLFVFAIFPFLLSAAGIPMVITHQGYITDKDGNGVTGNLSFSIGIYKSIDGDSSDLLWEEDLGSVSVKEGFYFIRVGDKGGLSDIFFRLPVWFLR